MSSWNTCNSLYYILKSKDLDRLQSIQHKAITLIFSANIYLRLAPFYDLGRRLRFNIRNTLREGKDWPSLSSNHTFPVVIAYVYRLLIALLRNALIVQVQIPPPPRGRVRSTHCMHFVFEISSSYSGSQCNAMTYVLRSVQAKIVHGSWACAYPCSCLKDNRSSLATPMKFGNFGPYVMLFMPTIIVTSCTVHALFMPSSCMLMGMNMYELGMNKGFNPIFHAHETYSHAHEVIPLLHAHKPLLRDQKHEHSLFMGMN